jgi:hypothetical protein
MGIVASGSALGRCFLGYLRRIVTISIGGVVYPILLNNLFFSRIGFHNGVRVSAVLNAGLLIIAIACMRTRLPVERKSDGLSVIRFLRDLPYVALIFG